jgi:adenosylhomocysteine nucleosidase
MPETKPIGILAALEEEMAELEAALIRARRQERAGVRFVAGRLDGRPVVLAEAGIGKVSAAQVTTLLLDRFDLVVAERLAQQDYGALTNNGIRNYRPGAPPFGERRHELYYSLPDELGARLRDGLAGFELPPLSAAATGSKPRRPKLHFGTILSGDQFINAAEARRALRRRFPGALAVEMEGAAAAQIAERHDAPCVVVRAVSDLAGAESHVDFLAFLPAAGAAAAMAVRRILPAL